MNRNKINKNERGYALLFVVILFAIMMAASVTNIVVDNLKALKNADTYSAIRSGEDTAIATISPIKRDISTQVDNKLRQLLKIRMSDFMQGKISTCQVSIPPEDLDKIDQQFSLCNPVTLLDNLQGSSKKSIDFFKYAKPQQPVSLAVNQNADWELRELERELSNEYDYTFETAYAGGQLIQEASPGRPRVELYRYMVQADVITHTYNDVYYAMRHNYDVSVVINTVGNSNVAPCDNTTSLDGSGAFLAGYEDCKPDSSGTLNCTYVPINTPAYNNTCPGGCSNALHACAAGNPCDDKALNGKRPITIGGFAKYFTGCETGGTGTTTIAGKKAASNLFDWSITVRPVGLGNKMF